MLSTNFGSHVQMVTKFGGHILATKFGFVLDRIVDPILYQFINILFHVNRTIHSGDMAWQPEARGGGY